MLSRLVCIGVIAAAAWGQPHEVERAARAAEAAWNRGDLERFVSYYDDSPETTIVTTIVSKGGRKAILESARIVYPTPQSMGTIQFSDLTVRPLADGLALLVGSYERRQSTMPLESGRFTLVWKRVSGQWKIIHDHTTYFNQKSTN